MIDHLEQNDTAVQVDRLRPQTLARDLVIGLLALSFGVVAIGFFSAGAYNLLSQIYNPAAALFIIGGFFAAVATLLVLYLALGGHETARAAHAALPADVAQASILDGLAPAVNGNAPDVRSDKTKRNRLRSLSLVFLGVALTSWTAIKRFTSR